MTSFPVPPSRRIVPVVALVSMLALWPGGHRGARAQSGTPAPVGVTAAIERSLGRAIRVPGSVESPRTSLVAAEVAGRVERVHAREGDVVPAGATLVSLRTTVFDIRLRAARAGLAEAEARLDLAARNLERADDLFASTVISRSALDDARSEHAAWRSRVENYEAQIAQAELDLERSVVRAPFAGVVVAEHAEVGEWIPVGAPCAELQASGALDVRVPVPERYFAILDRNATATVRFDSIPGLELDGAIQAVVPRADARARAFPVKVRIPAPDRRVAAGMLAEVEFRAAEDASMILVPKDALVTSSGRPAVWIVGSDGTVSSSPVRAGGGHGAWVEILEGVEAGQRVVSVGNERLRPGQAVREAPREYPLP